MKGSNFVATGVNSADAIAKAGFKTMMDLLAGKKPAQKDSTPPVQVVTPENAKQIYKPTRCSRAFWEVDRKRKLRQSSCATWRSSASAAPGVRRSTMARRRPSSRRAVEV